jgi:hypothetical protein
VYLSWEEISAIFHFDFSVIQQSTTASVVVSLRKEAKNILVDKYAKRTPPASNAHFNKYINVIYKEAGIESL